MYMAGRMAQCGLWFPPVDIPVGFGQSRTAKELPVLTMITGYSRWLSATLIPSTHANDVLASLWELIKTFGAIPQVLAWDDTGTVDAQQAKQAELVDKCVAFCRALGAKPVIGSSADPDTTGLIEWARIYLERSFLHGQVFASPTDFNRQLRDWLDTINTQQAKLASSAPTELVSIDRKAMLSLPRIPPPTGWKLSMTVGSRPFLCFDYNDYSVHPAVVGRRVELVASLSQVRVLCDGKLAAEHDRVWARGQTITDPAHAAVIRRNPPGL
jgi:Mu transposase-like protein